jgi:hypothetical protein
MCLESHNVCRQLQKSIKIKCFSCKRFGGLNYIAYLCIIKHLSVSRQTGKRRKPKGQNKQNLVITIKV